VGILRWAGGFVPHVSPGTVARPCNTDEDLTSSQPCVNAVVVCCFSEGFTTIFKIIVNKLGKYNLATYICKTKANNMTKTISQLRKEAKLAPKYVLKMDGLDLFVAEKQGLTGCNITEDVNKAIKYSVGFDNEEMKAGIWTAVAQRMTNNKDVKFEVMYL